jgi:hypothetical protein
VLPDVAVRTRDDVGDEMGGDDEGHGDRQIPKEGDRLAHERVEHANTNCHGVRSDNYEQIDDGKGIIGADPGCSYGEPSSPPASDVPVAPC